MEEMRHFVQYHNADSMGPYQRDPGGRRCGIVTNKSVKQLLGDFVWLITGDGTPKSYFLCEAFVVDDIDEKPGPLGNEAKAVHGRAFKRRIPIDKKPWFKLLRRRTGNFGFGLQRIKDQEVIRGLMELLSAGVDDSAPSPPLRTGAGFGSAAENRLVERAAIRAVTRDYKSRGWHVTSREHLCEGYDLYCRRGKREEHVEVKGIRGALCSFIITANETQASRYDPFFKLCVVTNARIPSRRKLWRFTGAKLGSTFDLQPIAFIAKPKTQSY